MVTIVNPDLPGAVGQVDENAFNAVWRHRGWVDAGELPNTDDLTVEEVLEQVGNDPGKASLALHAERQSRNRSTLTNRLAQLAGPQPEAAPEPAPVSNEQE